jgi:ribosome-associated protein
MRLDKLTKVAVTALEDIKARDILVLDVRKQTSLYDTLIIATAESARQTKALANNVREEIKAAGGSIIGTEGEDSGDWVLVDCADFVVHIMQPNVRTYYNLEELWTPPAPTREPKLPVVKKAASKLKPPAVAKPVAAKKPAAKKVATKAPATKKPAVKKAVAAKVPAAKKVVAKKVTPAVKKAVAAKAPAAKSPATTRRRLKAS